MGPFGPTDPRLSVLQMLGLGPGLPGPGGGPQQMTPGFRAPSAPFVQPPPSMQPQGMTPEQGMGMFAGGAGMMRGAGDYIRPPTPVSQMPTITPDMASAGGVGPIEPALAAGGTIGTTNPFTSWLRGLF